MQHNWLKSVHSKSSTHNLQTAQLIKNPAIQMRLHDVSEKYGPSDEKNNGSLLIVRRGYYTSYPALNFYIRIVNTHNECVSNCYL